MLVFFDTLLLTLVANKRATFFMFTPWHWYVYIIECLDKSYYTGMTWCISDRYEQHIVNQGSAYTRKHGVKRLAYYELHDGFDAARNREKQIKGWSRVKKEKLISGEWRAHWQ